MNQLMDWRSDTMAQLWPTSWYDRGRYSELALASLAASPVLFTAL
jgi:hypothetical protein